MPKEMMLPKETVHVRYMIMSIDLVEAHLWNPYHDKNKHRYESTVVMSHMPKATMKPIKP
jgi:hypothetical protein